MLNVKRLDLPFKVKEISDSGEFSGYGSVFGVEDSHGDVVVKGAFTESLERWREKGVLPSMLWQHDTKEPIGVYSKMVEDDTGLYVEGELLINDDPLARRAHAHLKAGSLSGLSIGYTLPNGWDYDGEKGVFILETIDLWECSIVTFPANDQARVDNVKTMLRDGIDIPPKIVERCLRDVGFSRQQAKAFMCDGYKAINPRDAAYCLELKKSLNGLIEQIRN